MKKIDNKKAIEEIYKMGYKVVGEYTGANDYVDAIEISTNYKVRVSYTNLKTGKSPIVFGYGNPYCVDNMIMYITQNYPNANIISHKQIISKKEKTELFTFKCECGEVFNRKWWCLTRKGHLCCNKCTLKKRGETRRIKGNEKISFIESKGYTLIDPPKTFTNSEKLLAKTQDGYIVRVGYNQLKQGKSPYIFDIRVTDEIYIHNINRFCEINNIETKAIEVLENKNQGNRRIKFRCGECGDIFTTTIRVFLGGKFRCSKCSNSMSNLEYNVKRHLEESNIDYVQEYVFKDCKDMLPLPFDFYLPNYNAIIEVDGAQHYQENAFFNNGTRRDLDIIQRHDNIKNDYCKNNNIKLLRIPYWKFKNDNYKELINNFIAS